jgi:hypothetical protein
LFDHKGVIEAKPPENTTLETAVEHAIEVGAEEVDELEDANDNVLQVCYVFLLCKKCRLPTYGRLLIVFCSPFMRIQDSTYLDTLTSPVASSLPLIQHSTTKKNSVA